MLRQRASNEQVCKTYDAMKSSYEQVKDNQAQLREEIKTLTTKVESKVSDISKEVERHRKVKNKACTHEHFHDMSDIGTTSPTTILLGETPGGTHIGKIQVDNGSVMDESILFPEDEDGIEHPASSPISSIPNIEEVGTESAWRSAVLPVLTTNPDMAVWEASEIYTTWISACHVKVGVAGTAPQAFFMTLSR